jgi:hypothetical protein
MISTVAQVEALYNLSILNVIYDLNKVVETVLSDYGYWLQGTQSTLSHIGRNRGKKYRK